MKIYTLALLVHTHLIFQLIKTLSEILCSNWTPQEITEADTLSPQEIFYVIFPPWAQWHLNSLASRLFTQPFIVAQIKENIKAPRHWTLCGEFTGDRWIPRINDQ